MTEQFTNQTNFTPRFVMERDVILPINK